MQIKMKFATTLFV